jgi:putative peptide zinc metalloprotease protein
LNLKIKSNLQFYQMDETLYHVYDPDAMKHFKIGKQQVEWLKMLDGKHTNDDLRKMIPKEFFEEFLVQVKKLNLLEDTNNKKKIDIFKIKFNLFNVNKILSKTGSFNTIFRTLLTIAFVLSVVISFFVIPLNYEQVVKTLSTINLEFTYIAFYFLSVILIGFFHEMAHSIVAKSYGVNVPNIGFMLFYFHPAFFADISGLNLLKSKKQRISILSAGVKMNGVLFTLSFLLFLAFIDSYPTLGTYFLLFSLINVILIVTNLIPFVEFDGYYILINLFEENQFKHNSFLSIKTMFSKKHPAHFKIEYLFYFVLSNLIALSMLYLAVIGVRDLIHRVITESYIDYIFLFLLALVTFYYGLRTTRRKV